MNKKFLTIVAIFSFIVASTTIAGVIWPPMILPY